MNMRLNRVVFILSLAGLVMGLYVLQSFLRQSSIVCLTGSGCEVVRKSPISYPFGIPVPAFGVAGYTLLLVFTFLRTLNPKLSTIYLKPILYVSIFGVCFVTWFTAMEIFVIKGICMWCAISAVNMYIIFCLIVYMLRLKPKT